MLGFRVPGVGEPGFVFRVQQGDGPLRMQRGEALTAGLEPFAAVLGLILRCGSDHETDTLLAGSTGGRTASDPQQEQGRQALESLLHESSLHSDFCFVKFRYFAVWSCGIEKSSMEAVLRCVFVFCTLFRHRL